MGSTLAAPSARAQEGHLSDRAKRETSSKQQAQQAATLAAEQASVLQETVTYQQVLADPDNIDLNFRYAKAQVAHGDLRWRLRDAGAHPHDRSEPGAGAAVSRDRADAARQPRGRRP